MSRETEITALSGEGSSEIESFLKQYAALNSGLSPEAKKQQEKLLAAVKEDVTSAEAWLNLLKHEEKQISPQHNVTQSQLRGEKGAVTLYRLFSLAVQTIPRHSNYRNHAYLQIWLGYAKQQRLRSEDEARDTFKMLKSQLIGESFAELYVDWARLEHAAGNVSRALAILKKGESYGAQPKSLLEEARAAIEATGSARNTAHVTTNSSASNLTSFMTPVVRSSSQRSPTCGVTLEARPSDLTGTTQLTAPPVNPTLTYTRGAAVEADGTTATKAPLTGITTKHSDSSEDATFTLQVKRPGQSPLTGHTVASNSSKGSVEETAEIAHSSFSTKAAAAAGQAAEDATCFVSNSVQHRKIVHRPLQSSLRGPRRIGLGGSAARVPSQQQATTSAAQGSPADASEVSGDKRKAQVELHNPPNPAPPSLTYMTSADGSKRRLSPDPEAARPSLQARPKALSGEHRAVNPPVASSAAGDPVDDASPAESREEDIELVGSDLARKARDSMAPSKAAHDLRSIERRAALVSAERRQAAKLQRATSGEVAGEAGASGQQRKQDPSHRASDLPVASPPRAPQPSLHRPKLIPPLPPGRSQGLAHKAAAVPASQPASASGSQADPARSSQTGRQPSPAPPAGEDVPAVRSGHAAAESHAAPSSERGPSYRPEKENAANRREAMYPGQAMGPPSSRQRQPLASIGRKQDLHQDQPQRPFQPVKEYYRPQVPHADDNAIVVKNIPYTKLETVGRGGSSEVFKVMAPNKKIFALKQIKLYGRDPEAAAGFVDEITLLQRLRGHSNIIQLMDAEVVEEDHLIYMVLEYGDIDLAGLLANHERAKRKAGIKEPDENFIRLYWQQMLQAVKVIHKARIVHSDLKPPNFLVVEGTLKLIDFGIAKAIQNGTTSIARESQCGTLNYMAPEAVYNGMPSLMESNGGLPKKVGRASDVWSLGCILYQMVYGRTPFASLPRNDYLKMHAITDPRNTIPFPTLKNPALQDTLRRCLDRDPQTRITMQELLDHPFLRPAPAPAAGLVGVTRSQLKKLLAHVTAVTEGGSRPTNIEALSDELFRQLSNGESVNLAALISRPPPAGCKGVPQAVTQPALKIGTKPEASTQGHMQHDVVAGKAALKKVVAKPVQRSEAESALEAKLREGIAKFRFDDTAGHSGLNDNDHSNNFSP